MVREGNSEGPGCGNLVVKALPSEKDPGSDECEHRADKNGTNSCLEYFQNLY